MATLRDIQRRIRSVQSTQKITRAMKLVAAAKLDAHRSGSPGPARTPGRWASFLGSLSPAGDEGHPLLARWRRRKRLVIITADKGLCGAFNSNVARASPSSSARGARST